MSEGNETSLFDEMGGGLASLSHPISTKVSARSGDGMDGAKGENFPVIRPNRATWMERMHGRTGLGTTGGVHRDGQKLMWGRKL